MLFVKKNIAIRINEIVVERYLTNRETLSHFNTGTLLVNAYARLTDHEGLRLHEFELCGEEAKKHIAENFKKLLEEFNMNYSAGNFDGLLEKAAVEELYIDSGLWPISPENQKERDLKTIFTHKNIVFTVSVIGPARHKATKEALDNIKDGAFVIEPYVKINEYEGFRLPDNNLSNEEARKHIKDGFSGYLENMNTTLANGGFDTLIEHAAVEEIYSDVGFWRTDMDLNFKLERL